MEPDILKLMSSNLNHFRLEKIPLLAKCWEDVQINADRIISFFKKHKPDVIAAQELEALHSRWSGKDRNGQHVDSVSYLADNIGDYYAVFGSHFNYSRLQLSWGTALFSRMPFKYSTLINISTRAAIFSKGIVIGTFFWPGSDNIYCDVISLHLSCTNRFLRKLQVQKIIKSFPARKRPLIVMGDFNCEWKQGKSALCKLAEGLNLSTYKPEENIITRPNRVLKLSPYKSEKNIHARSKAGKRLDWILVSKELDITDHQVFDDQKDIFSDHLVVSSQVKIKEEFLEAYNEGRRLL